MVCEQERDNDGHRVFVGLSNGQIHEFRLSKDLNRFEKKKTFYSEREGEKKKRRKRERERASVSSTVDKTPVVFIACIAELSIITTNNSLRSICYYFFHFHDYQTQVTLIGSQLSSWYLITIGFFPLAEIRDSSGLVLGLTGTLVPMMLQDGVRQ